MRPLTGLERVWLVADRLWPPFVNQLVVEGEGELSADAWRAALKTVAAAWPGASARLGGALKWTRWTGDGAPPALREVTGEWDGRGPAEWTGRPLDPARGPVVEVVLVRGARPKVVLRTHHALFDGRAAWMFAQDLGAALRREPVKGAGWGPPDLSLVGPGPAPDEPRPDAPLPYEPVRGRGPVVWGRRSVVATPGHVLPRVLIALAAAARGHLRVSIPVDLRPKAQPTRGSVNLTGFVRVEVPPRGSPTTVATIINRALSENEAAGPVRTAEKLRQVPLWVMEAAGRRAAEDMVRHGQASVSATVSNLGLQDPGVLAGAGFTPRRHWWIPPGGGGSALFVTLTGHPEGIEICAAAPGNLADAATIERLLDGMARGLAT